MSTLIICGVRLPILEIMPGQAVLLLSSSSVVAVFSLLLATLHYKVTDTHLRLNLAFFDVLGGRIRLENILNIVFQNGNMYLSYIWKGADPVIAQIAVKSKHFEKLKDALMKANPNIVFFDRSKEKREEEE